MKFVQSWQLRVYWAGLAADTGETCGIRCALELLIDVEIVRHVGELLEGDMGLDNGLGSWLAHVVVVVVVVSDDGGVLDLS